ncbi:pyrroline-5-carboxylate reductase [Sphingomonas sp. RB56-2]|uniref:Pyrroline-5-carboxylate reductase n=1 Tax=Sphingomonas brevis TaxID=2908206 RepID=A0ABT0S8L4_9SPHN|nr:pyrroline-5-carboxylate reductase dimerization domain-containing protein [Sphingomonas brevis]MCL6740451.1 pyrroline-5-carboxylate reductase [Sphingomonas brevis]
MTATFPVPAWLVGCGNMAGAMVDGWRAGGADFTGVTVVRPSGTPVEGIRTITDYPDERPRFVMLGFKPQKLAEVAPGLAPHVGPETVLVSMLAGVTAATLRELFPNAGAIVRIMPNLPVAQVQGVTAIYSADDGFDEITALIASLGMIAVCRREEELGVIGAVASAGMAYVARFIEALGKGGKALGLRPEQAEQIAIQTLVGTGAYAAETAASMTEIALRVASPKGTTEQGLAVLDAPDGLQQLVDRTLAAAVRRGKELAEEAARRN